MKKVVMFRLILGLFFVLILLSNLSFVSAGFKLGINSSQNIELNYGASELLRGFINISFQNEQSNSSLNAFGSNMSLKEFLELNSADYTCIPSDCENGYSTIGSGTPTKTFSLNYWETKLLGVKLAGQVTGIDTTRNFVFNVLTNAGASCLNPVKIDVLDDGAIEWKSDSISNETCFIEKSSGCWNQGSYISGNEFILTEDKEYCEKINISFGKGFKLGAEIIGTGSADFKLSITAGETQECSKSISSGGNISCLVEFEESVDDDIQAIVCISRENSGTNEYKIKYEDNSPCGFVGTSKFDFPISAYPRKYSAISSISFDSQLAEEIGGYISTRYDGNCTSGCFVPIRIYSGISQTINVSNLKLYYERGGTQLESNIYEIKESGILINSELQKLDLGLAELFVPSSLGIKDLILKLNDEKILERKIQVKAIPTITEISPKSVPVLVPTTFRILLNDSVNITYTWDFGDETAEQITTTNKAVHTYSALGTYSLKITAESKLGNSSKTFQITAVSPKEYINTTINKYYNNLNKTETEINKFPEWIKKEFEKKINVESLRTEIKAQATKYDSAFTDEDYVKIMTDLLAIKVPNSLNTSMIITPSKNIPSGELNLDALDYFGAGTPEEDSTGYASALINWFSQSLDMIFESKTYSLYYDNEETVLGSYVKVTLTPKPDLNLGEVYFLINGNPLNIKLNTEEKTKDFEEQAVGIIFSELNSPKTIEFLYPEKISLQTLPIIISPEFKNLELGVEPGVCNSNKKCEKNLGETYKNCRNDCKPIGWTIFWIVILFFGAFVVYIILQEWYKKYYEKYLFKDKNQLFNLINYLNNSLNQGLGKDKIFEALKRLKWNNEQIDYAWKRLKGKRTGMFEIPVLKFVEQRQVKRELEKRGGIVYPR
ncbi:MAG: PKD domain-containing protein [Nanoarchaeota archaeon]